MILAKNNESLKAISLLLSKEIGTKRELQEMVELASYICQTPVALISFIDEKTQYLKFKFGTAMEDIALEDTFCQYLIDNKQVLEIPDALQDQRFYDNKLVANYPYIRFYAGTPLITRDGINIGSLCTLGTAPKRLSESQKQRFSVLALRIVELIEVELDLPQVA